MAEAPTSSKQQAQIKADEKELLGQYSNLVVVHHNAEEFTLNFVYMFPTRAAGQARVELDHEPEAREAADAGAGGKRRHDTKRNSAPLPEGTGANSGAERRVCAIGSDAPCGWETALAALSARERALA